MTADGTPPPARATLADVARLAGVSAKTAARAVNGEDHVRPETRERVTRAAAALRFRPNRLARELRQGARTGAVGLVIGGLDNPFYSQVAAGVERALREQHLELVIASTDDEPEREASVVHGMLERRVRALLIVPAAGDHTYLEGERQLGTPVVFLDRPPVTLAADTVLWDNRDGVHQAVASLVAHGHRRLAVLADSPSFFTARERCEAFREAMAEAGLPVDERYVVDDVRDVEAARTVALRLLALDPPPTALLAMNNRISVGVTDVLLRGDSGCALVGFDEFDLAPALGITVVAADPRELGYRAGQVALARMADPSGRPEELRLPATLVRRGSGERPPVEVPPQLRVQVPSSLPVRPNWLSAGVGPGQTSG